jgi:hypothetical protein
MREDGGRLHSPRSPYNLNKDMPTIPEDVEKEII